MTNKAPKSMTIVGGGTAGWMCALYLNKLFNHGQRRVDLTVIESPEIGIIGVGEATVHTIRMFFAAMGLDEHELLRESHATLKTGILFRNWMQPVDGKMHEYFHPFEQQRLGRILDISSAWMLNERCQHERYDEGVSIAAHLIKSLHGPKANTSKQYSGVVPYGYHLDATKLAQFLRRKAVEAGVVHVEATVENVMVSADRIDSVQTTKGSFTADVFLDCTGFKGLLIEKLRANNWQSYADALPCTKAVAMQQEYPHQIDPRPYTVATALSNGWVWEIDLVHRRGTGYVYDGNRLTRDQAEAELRQHLGAEATILKTLHLDMKVGRRKEFWVGNCIAIGLAGGFIEPLESTGLHLINLSARLFATHTPGPDVPQTIRDSYNRLMIGYYEDLKRFIVLHYCLSNRTDTDFWRSAQETVKYCPQLEELLALWQHKICEYADLAGTYSSVFTDENYRYILYGMNHYPALNLPFDAQENQKVFAEFTQLAQSAVQTTLPHAEFLRRLAMAKAEAPMRATAVAG